MITWLTFPRSGRVLQRRKWIVAFLKVIKPKKLLKKKSELDNIEQ
jgi:hypothetical protein